MQDEAPGAARRLLRWFSALLLVGLMIGAGYQILRWEPQYLPIRVVTVDGELQRLAPKRLQETVVDHLHGGIVTQDLAELKEAVEELAWVRSASLRRVWPDRLDLTVVEHKPLCRWGEDGLVSDEGVVFRPPVTEFPKGLPILAAVDERAPLLVARYRAWSPRFAARGLAIERMLLDARGAWSIRTDAGFELALGKLEVEERTGRFLRAWPSLAEVGRPEQVDMRYSNGLSVRWSITDEGARDTARAQAGSPGAPGPGSSGGRSVSSLRDRVWARINDFLPRSPRS